MQLRLSKERAARQHKRTGTFILVKSTREWLLSPFACGQPLAALEFRTPRLICGPAKLYWRLAICTVTLALAVVVLRKTVDLIPDDFDSLQIMSHGQARYFHKTHNFAHHLNHLAS